ncbi:vacuolar membrane-associated protein iml1 [Coemansia sp. Benny D115]|nr:vacuolar membrane-associated protein iml1 [Coemansia sp. Benny D115]
MLPRSTAAAPAAGQKTKRKSIFDRRGVKPSSTRSQTGKNSGNSGTNGSKQGLRNAQGVLIDDPNGTGASLLFNKVCVLRAHEDVFSSSDLVMNPAFFPGIRVGDIVSIKPLYDGEDVEQLVSPKGSFDSNNDGGAAAHAAAPTTSSKSKNTGSSGATGEGDTGSSQPASTAAAAATITGENGATGDNNSGRTETKNPSFSRLADAGYRTSVRRDVEEKHRMCSGGGSTSHLPKMANRWIGTSERDIPLLSGNFDRTEEDEADIPFKPSPHHEILLQVGEIRRDSQQLQASILTHVARALWSDYTATQRVAIRKIDMSSSAEREKIRADFVEIAFRDQYVGRSDMWRLWRALSQKIVHTNKPTNMEGLIRASVRRIYKDNVQIPCGYIDSSTQPIFRSESGRFIIFIQMSEEMWAYQEDGNLCFEKAVNCFLAELFRRWNEKQLNHMVTIVMFSRWYYHVRDSLYFQDLTYDEDRGRYYRDYYKVIADMEVRPDWTVFLPEILSEFNSYRRDIQELLSTAGRRLRGDLSKANQGNILEAINLGINSFASNHVDRDLSRTGLSTVVITPSFGVFDVQKKMLRMTTERMLHYGTRVDFVCLASKPLFRPPVFRFKSLPVPSEQEQRRALQRRRQAKESAILAKATSSVSPLSENPGTRGSPVGTGTTTTASGAGGGGVPSGGIATSGLPKDRGANIISAANADAMIVVDPIMLDPLYFDDENWENELLPYLTDSYALSTANASGIAGGGGGALGGGISGSGRGSHRLNSLHADASSRTGQSERSPVFRGKGGYTTVGGSVISTLLGNKESVTVDIPETIQNLSLDDYPFFAHERVLPSVDRRVVYNYFPYWVDCGFYNYTDERVTERFDDFRPSCKMGDLSVNGVSNYMHTPPAVPDLEFRAMDTELASLLGLEQQLVPSTDSPANEFQQQYQQQLLQQQQLQQRSRDEDNSSTESRHPAAMPKDTMLARKSRLSPVIEHQALKDMFENFDRRAIVGGAGIANSLNPGDALGTGVAAIAPDTIGAGHHSNTFTTMQPYSGSTGDHRHPLASTPAAAAHASQTSNMFLNSSRHWDESHSLMHSSLSQQRQVSAKSAGATNMALSTSNDAHDRILVTVSTSASPNLTHGQLIKAPARPDQNTTMSSSAPHEVKLGTSINSTHSQHPMQSQQQSQPPPQQPQQPQHQQRTSVFMRNNSQRKRSYQQNIRSGSAETRDTSDQAILVYHQQAAEKRGSTHSAATSGPSPDLAPQGGPTSMVVVPPSGSKWQKATPEHGLRNEIGHVSSSPQSTHRNQYMHGSQERHSGEAMVVSGIPGERAAVSESMAKQSHLNDHIRTFRGATGSHEMYHLQQHPQLIMHYGLGGGTGGGGASIAQPVPSAQRHSALTNALSSDVDFQLTLPAARQASGGAVTAGQATGGPPVTAMGNLGTAFRTVPSQPLVPGEYKSGSPQYGKNLWVNERLSLAAHLSDQPQQRGPRGRAHYTYNPCNPELSPLPLTELSQRWAMAFPTYWLLSSYTPKWRSLCTPASLPLVTDYYPTDLATFYRKYGYQVNTPDMDTLNTINMPAEDYDEFAQFMTGNTPSSAPVISISGGGANGGVGTVGDPGLVPHQIDRVTRLMLKEMIYQRLAQGFQFVNIGEIASGTGKGSRDMAMRTAGWNMRIKPGVGRSGTGDWPGMRGGSDVLVGAAVPHQPLVPVTGMMQRLDTAVWLSNGREIQKFELQESGGSIHIPGITVTRWVRNKKFDQDDIKYRFQMWSRNNNMGYNHAKINFSYPSNEDVNWSSLDKLIMTHQTNLMKSTKFWRARYILIPMDQLGNDTIVNTKSNPQMSVEDVRIANFEKFLDHVLRMLRKDERSKLEDRFLSALPSDMIRSSTVFSNHVGGEWGQNRQAPEPQQQPQSLLTSLTPSAVMQIRYTTLYPVPYLFNQLYSYMNDAVFLDPTLPISLPTPAVVALNLVEPLNVESPFSQLSYALQHPKAGIGLRNIRWHYSSFKSIFVGYQMVDWILVNFDNVVSRGQAAIAGNRLLERGIFVSVQNKTTLIDGHHFYAFTDAALAHKVNQPAAMQQQQQQHQQSVASSMIASATSRAVQSSFISNIGFNDKNNRHVGNSNNPSPNTSRPGSRQGSAAPSVNNDGEQGAVSSTAATAGAAISTITSTTAGASAGNGASSGSNVPSGSGTASKKHGVGRTSLSRETGPESPADSWIASGAQPSSKLRVRTDTVATRSSSSAVATDTSSINSNVHGPEHIGADPSGDSSKDKEKDKGGRNSGHRQLSQRLLDRRSSSGRHSDSHGISSSGRTTTNASSHATLSPLGVEYLRTPEMFPQLSGRRSKRPLPKNLYQSRLFSLDLDQQRKSSRIEHCLVHLDAVQNPMTCFHLSINWLNCTNHLIDELVKGWARMAERCGMRLVEAPRAQDTSIEDSHPFHSPIRIKLLLPPPSVERIFDEEWVADFEYLGDSDSEPESSDNEDIGYYKDESTCTSDGDEDDDDDDAGAEIRMAKSRRARALKRMSKCIPTYPFERELLEEQDFILDVEAETNYPKSKLLHREYTFERQGYEYTQYVHRSGTAFVQICGPGEFLWINNYLFTSHQNHLRSQQQQQQQQNITSAPSQMSLGSFATGRGDTGVSSTANFGTVLSAADMSAVSTPPSTSGKQPTRADTQSQGQQRHFGEGALSARGEDSAEPDAFLLPSPISGPAASRMVPAYYPVRHNRDLWPHQKLPSLSVNRLASNRLVIPEWYSKQVVDNLGMLPTDFDSVNAAITRVSILQQVAGDSVMRELSENTTGDGRSSEKHLDHIMSPLYNENRAEWVGQSTPPPSTGVNTSSASAGEANPDVLRANFVEICEDRNSLEMLWQQTISKYRNGWRIYRNGQAAGTESPKSKPMVIDMFSEGMWQQKQQVALHETRSSKQGQA